MARFWRAFGISRGVESPPYTTGNQIMWTNTVEPDRPQMTIWRTRIACWIPKVTNTHSEYVILIAFALQQWLHECVSVLCYMYITCLVMSIAYPLPAIFLVTSYCNPYESKRTSPEECAGIAQWVATLHWTDGPGIESLSGREILLTRPDQP